MIQFAIICQKLFLPSTLEQKDIDFVEQVLPISHEHENNEI